MCVSTEWIKHTLLQRAVSWPEGGRVRLQAAGREWLRELDGSAEEKMDVLRSHRVIQISIHLIVQLVNGVDSRGEVEEEFSDFLQALLVLDLPTFGEGPQEIWLIWSGEKSRLKRSKTPYLHTTQRISHERPRNRRWTHPEELLHPPAVILLQGYLVGFGDVDSDEVWVAIVLFTVHQALKEDLDESKTPGCGKKWNTVNVGEKMHLNLINTKIWNIHSLKPFQPH